METTFPLPSVYIVSLQHLEIKMETTFPLPSVYIVSLQQLEIKIETTFPLPSIYIVSLQQLEIKMETTFSLPSIYIFSLQQLEIKMETTFPFSSIYSTSSAPCHRVPIAFIRYLPTLPIFQAYFTFIGSIIWLPTCPWRSTLRNMNTSDTWAHENW